MNTQETYIRRARRTLAHKVARLAECEAGAVHLGVKARHRAQREARHARQAYREALYLGEVAAD